MWGTVRSRVPTIVVLCLYFGVCSAVEPAEWLDENSTGEAKIQGFQAGKKGSPGVVLVHEWWGVSAMVKQHADALAAEGYRVLVPNFAPWHPGHDHVTNLLGGKHDFTKAAWWRAMSHGITEEFLPGVNATVSELHREGTQKVAVVGFCLGGAIAVSALAKFRGVAAAISFSGVPFNLPSTPLRKPFQAHFGAASLAAGFSDKKATASLTAKCSAENEKQVFVYEGAGHGFFNNHQNHAADRRKMNVGGDVAADTAAAEAAWPRAIDFLSKHLRQP